MNARYLEVAQDPRIIHGVHHHCDEWCDYCPLTDRCLAFRCTGVFRKEHGRREGEPTFASLDEAVAFTRDLSAIDGTSTAELDALLSSPPGRSGLGTSDPLASIAMEYAIHVAMMMTAGALTAAKPSAPRASVPAPADVVVWYHLRIYMRILRALVAHEGHGPCRVHRLDEALGSAKLALVSIRRSRDALRALRSDDNQDDVAELIARLDALERGLDERLPAARSYVRLGLDVPVM